MECDTKYAFDSDGLLDYLWNTYRNNETKRQLCAYFEFKYTCTGTVSVGANS